MKSTTYYFTICTIDSQGEFCSMSQETQTGALHQPRGVEWGGRWDGGSKGRGVYIGIYIVYIHRYIYIYLWLIHVEV